MSVANSLSVAKSTSFSHCELLTIDLFAFAGTLLASCGVVSYALHEILTTALDEQKEYRYTIGAATGSFLSTIAGFPLDSVKSRLQVKRYSGVLDCVRATYQSEGLAGFYRGVLIPLLTITMVRTASFSIYTGTKEEVRRQKLFTKDTIGSTAALGFSGGASSGMLLSLGTTAFEYVKISQQLEYLLATKRGIPFQPKGTVRGFLDLYKEGGFRGLYTGFRLHALRDTLGTGLYFCFYDSGKWYINHADHQVLPQVVSTFLCGSLAGIASWAIIYPIDLVKAKVQRNALAQTPAVKPWTIFRRISSGGVTKLYRGLGISATRSLLSHGLMWVILENVQATIARRTGHGETTE